jgi:HNH endonuclease
MRSLPIPPDDPVAVYALCISRVRDPGLKASLSNISPQIGAAATAFDVAARAAMCHTVVGQTMIGTVTAEQLAAVYNNNMARRRSPGRIVYDRLLAAAPHSRCPLCGQRNVATLDHHLPKSIFPVLAVAPANLIPACFDCNKKKGETTPSCAEDQTLHPYYDTVDNEGWLAARITHESPPAITFAVYPPSSWSPIKQARLRHHFRVFALDELYGLYAAQEIVNIRHYLGVLFAEAGEGGVQIHLNELANSYELAQRNSWQAAAFRALAASDWYCAGGFK